MKGFNLNLLNTSELFGIISAFEDKFNRKTKAKWKFKCDFIVE